MKAGVLYGNEDIRYEEIETPAPTAGTVRVKVAMTGICGSDVPRVLYHGAHFYPIVLGHEFSGTVDAIGDGVKGFSVGDKVSGIPLIPCMQCEDCKKGNFSLCKHYTFVGSRIQGSFAEYVLLPAQNVIKFDPSLSFEQGALFEPASVSLHGVKCANYRAGEDVAIIGAGTIGLFAMQWAKIFGAKTVTVLDISDSRLSLAKKLGADFVVNTKVEKVESKYGFVFEAAGNPVTTKMAFEAAANKATVCFIGTPHSDTTFAPHEWENLNRKEMIVTGSWMSYSAPFPGDEWTLTAHYFRTGQLKYVDELVFKKFPMSQISDAFALYKNGTAEGKIMLYNE